MKILVCDDESITRDVHIDILIENGMSPDNIIEASDGNEALKLLNEHKIDLFLVDWYMPGLDGVELVKAIRNMKEYEETPIIMITIEGGRYSIIKAFEAGITNYILKPIVADVFWLKLEPYIKDLLHKN
jgi:two-component system chemotaxis response regulator CheY